METALTKREKEAIQRAVAPKPPRDPIPVVDGGTAIAIRHMDDLYRLAEAAVKGGYAPKGMDAMAAMVSMAYGMELGLSPFQALQSMCVIQGRPSMYGDAALGLCMARKSVFGGIQEELIADEKEGLTGVCKVMRKDTGQVVTRRFSMADAKTAGLLGKDNWKNYPKRMLQFRARSWALRDCFPDVLKGIIQAEEAEDMPAPREIREVRPERQVELSLDELKPEAVTGNWQELGGEDEPKSEEPKSEEPNREMWDQAWAKHAELLAACHEAQIKDFRKIEREPPVEFFELELANKQLAALLPEANKSKRGGKPKEKD